MTDKKQADGFWTILCYFKSLKDLGRLANKITAELQPEIKQLQVRHLKNAYPLGQNYYKLSFRNLELTSRIPSDKIKKNLDKLDLPFEGDLEERKAYDLVVATNMISVGLDVSRLNVMIMNGMPPNTAEYIQASSRVARASEGVVFTLYDPNNSRDLSYFEDFVPFHKTFYKQVEPLSVTPFAENALDKMLFTLMVSYFRHKLGQADNNMSQGLIEGDWQNQLKNELSDLFNQHPFLTHEDKDRVIEKIDKRIEAWKTKIEADGNKLFFNGTNQATTKRTNLLIAAEGKQTELRMTMQSMRSVEPQVTINLKKM